SAHPAWTRPDQGRSATQRSCDACHDFSMAIQRYRYLHLDVFTDRRFGGNQLAVFPDAAGLSSETMQSMAREMNFAESTFVTPAESSDADVRMRIFTPSAEMPMAGHP